MTTSDEMQLIRKLRSPDDETVIQVLEELRERSLLFDGTLKRMDLRCAHLRGADLHQANLQGADLRMADLRDADLSEADLSHARLNRANLRGTNLDGANLQDADLFNTNLEQVHHLTVEQLTQAYRLRAATMPEGSRYDGRYNLRGDQQDSQVIHVDPNDTNEMADFYRVSVGDYKRGQLWAKENLVYITRELESEAASQEAQFVVQLRSQDNQVVLKTIEQLREQGWLDTGMLKGVDLKGANLKGANLNLAAMEGADLSEANLEAADLSVTNLYKACLFRVNLKKARLLWARLQSADLAEADLQGADLTGANLRNARLENANLQRANLGAVNLKRADLSGANLEGVNNLREEELAKAHRLDGATMADGSRYDGRLNLPGDIEAAAAPLKES
jgi:uncharacterized protein YjbI with pentapeptide repeats